MGERETDRERELGGGRGAAGSPAVYSTARTKQKHKDDLSGSPPFTPILSPLKSRGGMLAFQAVWQHRNCSRNPKEEFIDSLAQFRECLELGRGALLP